MKNFKKLSKIIALVGAVAILALLLTGCDGNDDAEYTIGILQHFEHPALNAARDGFISGLADEGFIEGENLTFLRYNAIGDVGNNATMAARLVDAEPDLILGIATPSSQALRAATQDIPVVFTAITDPLAAGLVEDFERPNTNLTGMSDLLPIIEQFRFLMRILPEAQTVGIMYNSGEINSVIQAEMAADAARELGLSYIRAAVTGTHDVAQIAASIAGQVDVIFSPTCNTMAEAMTTAVMVAGDEGVPIISGDSGGVERGALATEGIDYYYLGRQTAAMAVQILRGEAIPQEMPVQWQDTRAVTVNMATAEHLGIEIPADILAVARIIE